ncbi:MULTISPECIES: S41 family peptidase [Mesonia]|uniref:S41 family peptidase n=1 Tax=Mesonia sp. TaxID=1960830 RepID=UPI000C60D6FC|nr:MULTISPECIES: S41 family peptidase [Mesonia]MAN26935.1 peptidase S41 [Mesonia sp.]MAQ40769.1 peptidase S41 [Mesonia sp.]MBJ98474.1 peptidase S41 [Flavobacteriaceae bacterium]
MNTYSKKYLPLIIGAACAIGVLIGSSLDFSDNSEGLFAKNAKKEKLNRLIDYIDYEYVDEVNTDSIVDITVNKILEDLDPHSTYIPKKKYDAVAENMKGDFVGIGVSFYTLNDTIAVIRAIADGPSEKAGIKAGDRILYADGIELAQNTIGTDSLSSLLKGEINTIVNLKVQRKGEEKLLNFKVKRGKIPIKSVDAAYMLTNKLGYVKVNRFAETTYEEFETAIENLIKQGATELALDLRDNGGGYLDQAVKIADEFLSKKKLIVFTKNKSGEINKTFATDKGKFENTKVYVLINENSASASEVVAGALQDNDIGIIVGRRSYGKGLVQREMNLGDGSAVRLTVARYYTPTGRSIQKPYASGNKEYFNEYHNRYTNGELQTKDSIHVNDSLRYETPEGKIVYGGGGIIPDVFVPKNTDFEKESLTYMLRGGVMDRFIFNILEKNRSYYNQISQQEFEEEEMISEEILEEYIAYLNEFNFDFKTTNYRYLLKKYLRATMAEQLFGTNAFEKIINQDDAMIEKILELEKNPS